MIRNNVIFDNHGSGIHMNGDLSQGGDGIISQRARERQPHLQQRHPNSTYPRSAAAAASTWTACRTRASRTICVYNNHASGISLYKIDGAAGSTGNVVVNNTVHEASDGRWALNIQNGSTGNTVRNNILISDHPFRGAIDISPDSLPRLHERLQRRHLALHDQRRQLGADARPMASRAPATTRIRSSPTPPRCS